MSKEEKQPDTDLKVRIGIPDHIETVRISRDRRVNFGDQDYEDEKIILAVIAPGTLEAVMATSTNLMVALNELELETRRNHLAQKQIWHEERVKIRTEITKETEAKERQQRAKLLRILIAHPDLTLSDLTKAMDLTEHDTRDLLHILEQEGKIKIRDCRRLYDLVDG